MEFFKKIKKGVILGVYHGSHLIYKNFLGVIGNSLIRMSHRSVVLTQQDPRTSKQVLIQLLQLEAALDRGINLVANHYYQGKHPKHFLWISHNDFIVDHVKTGDRVLDLGCGASQYTLRLAEKGAEVLCVDINPERIAKMKEIHTHPNLKFSVLDIRKNLPVGRFDVAISSHLLEHLDEPVFFLQRIKKIAPKLIVKVPRIDSGWKKLMKKDLEMFWLDDRDHRKEYTMEILLNELDEGGWVPIITEKGIDLRVFAEHKT